MTQSAIGAGRRRPLGRQEPMASSLPIDLSALPAELRAAVEAQQAALEVERAARQRLESENAALAERNARREHLVKEFKRALHGKKSEKLSADQLELVFEDLETAMAETEAIGAPPTATLASRSKGSQVNRNLGRLPKELPRIERVIEPERTLCPCGCGEMVRIGEDRTERLDIEPARFRVIATIRPKYACRACEGGVSQAPAPAHLIEGGLPTEGAIAHVLISKYCDHAPLYRQAKIYARAGLDLHRSTLAGWVGKAAFHLGPIVDRLAEHLKRSAKLFMDETTAPVLDPGRRRTKTGYLWALARDDRAWGGVDPPGVVYFYAPGRGGAHAEAFLKGFSGTLQVDAYAGYNRLSRPDRAGGPLELANCWAHARRKLHEIAEKNHSGVAEEGLRRIAAFYRIEAEIRGLPPAQRFEARQARTKPLIEAFGVWLKEQRARISPKSRLGEKLSYIANHWDGLQVFLGAGADSDRAEARACGRAQRTSAPTRCPAARTSAQSPATRRAAERRRPTGPGADRSPPRRRPARRSNLRARTAPAAWRAAQSAHRPLRPRSAP